MAHPKRRQSKSRQKKRRSNKKKIKIPQLIIDNFTNKKHIFHHAYWHNEKLYYKGKVIFFKKNKKNIKNEYKK
ncbi:50S ribosomal protein L32 [Candidatus Shikimatogenerans silvanidophilus]|uniref:50S ribosomal protein L32 n=1 Tax=Candidatus Shikimatogenerans silvanidophilus TaxID=2782547 RepID=UPI001BA9EDA0|nr:50S ribosomal protein L32 [Candidatus Shikimatogenerans silvanidophilus]